MKHTEGFLVSVDQQDANTLLLVLQEYVLPGTTVVSDLWWAHGTINQLGYQHLTVNHSLDPNINDIYIIKALQNSRDYLQPIF